MEQDHIRQLEILKTAVKELDGRFDKQDKRFDSQDDKLGEIYDALTGNDKLGNTGLVARIKMLEASEKRWEKLYYKGLGFMIAAWVVLTAFQIFITIKFK
jgi:hypothetical protein